MQQKFLEKTLGQQIADMAAKYPDDNMIDYTDRDYSRTWKEFNDECETIARGFMALGLKKGSHISIWGTNVPAWLLTFFGSAKMGGILVTVNTSYKVFELDYQLKQSDSEAIVLIDGYKGTSYIDIINELCPELESCEPGKLKSRRLPLLKSVIYAGEGECPAGMVDWKDLYTLAEQTPVEEFEAVRDSCDCHEVVNIQYTSGTTGFPKGVMLTHGNLASVVTSSCMCFQGGNSVGFLPLNHTFSWVATIFAAFIIITYGYICVDIKNLVKDFQTHHPQNFSGVPLVVETIYKRVWKTARKTGREEVLKKGIKISRFLLKFGIDVRRKLFAQVHEQLGGNLKYIIVGGAALDPEYEQGLYDLGIQVLNGYGITECSPAVTTNTMENHKSGSVGRPLPCNEIKINDPDEDGVGEIYVRGSNVMRGYYKDPEATAAAFDNGWFKTGDYGRIDEDGFLFFVGRKKNLIITNNGKNVSPEELEDKLSQRCHAIHEILVSQEGNKIVAEVYPYYEDYGKEADQLIKDAVNQFNRDMPRWKNIDKLEFRSEEFPKTTTLKIRRNYKELEKAGKI